MSSGKKKSGEALMELKQIAEKYIRKQERFYNRPLKSFNKFLIREFVNFLQKENLLSSGQSFAKRVEMVEAEKIEGNKIKVAFISEEIGHLTGGRYYAWFMAIALCELGFDVTIYTNQKPIYYDSFKDYKLPKMELIDKQDLESIDVLADLYISSPLLGNIAVCRLAEKYNKPAYCMVFDPTPMMKDYVGHAYSGWDRLVPKLRDAKVNIISLCKATSDCLPEWLNKRMEQIIPIYPCINSRELKKATPGPREDYVLFVSRIVKHKKFEDVLQAVKPTNMRLKVVSSNRGVDTDKMLKTYGMLGCVDFYYNVEDEEKFNLMYRAKAIVSGSIFEGFGMWAAEAVATGTPLVCYEFPTVREIEEVSGAENFYFAKWNDPIDLALKLKECLSEAKYGERSIFFDFESMIKRVNQVFSPEPRIGVITIALNEEQYISASLRSVIKHPNIKKVAVVEGAVNLFAHASNEKGLSVDDTQVQIFDAVLTEHGNKIIYEQYGWASDKSELRNRALILLGKDIDYVLVVDADEVWKQEDLDNLVQGIKDNPRTGVILFNFYHFWKQKDLIAVGGQWNSQMFRCFKYENKNLHWKNHGAPVVDSQDRFINVTDGQVLLENVHVYHYGAMKDEKRIKEKLEFYAKRDTHLTVKNTWSDWKPGKETQWTHGGGTTEKFDGTHPSEVNI